MEFKTPPLTVYYWSGHAMITDQWLPYSVGYVQVSEVTRLLELAHQQGYEQGKADAAQEKRK